jgi:hypothetical protein
MPRAAWWCRRWASGGGRGVGARGGRRSGRGSHASRLAPHQRRMRGLWVAGLPCSRAPRPSTGASQRLLSAQLSLAEEAPAARAPTWRSSAGRSGRARRGLTCRHRGRVAGAQVGLAEMKPVVEATGGMVVQTDTFLNPVFKESFKRVFALEAEEGYLAVASNATFEVPPRCAPAPLCCAPAPPGGQGGGCGRAPGGGSCLRSGACGLRIT